MPSTEFLRQKIERLRIERDGLRASAERLQRKINAFRVALAKEADASAKFKLEEDIVEAEQELGELNRRIDGLEEQISESERQKDVAIDTDKTRPLILPKALQALLDKVRNSEGSIDLSPEEANAIKSHNPADLTEYRLCRIAEWSLPQYYLDKRFVNLTLIVDKGEHEVQRWQGLPADEFRFNDLRDVLEKRKDDRALVVLGVPGSGKSTLLRRLQLDHSVDRLRDGTEQISFFVPLNSYREDKNGHRPEPREWLDQQWTKHYPSFSSVAPLKTFLQQGRVLLLLDALNEMPHKDSDDYDNLVLEWQAFVQEAAGRGNRILFSCRKLDYSVRLSSEALRVPQIEVQPMDASQVREFLNAYTPEHQERIWKELEDSPQLSFFQTPYFLKLLCELAEKLRGELPKGRAGLFTGFVRQALDRQCEKKDALFKPSDLLDERDRNKLLRKEWSSPFDLPERGALISKLSDLAYTMQEKRPSNENSQVRIKYDTALNLLAHGRAKEILKAGVALNVLDDDSAQDDILFFHQLLQEYFAARRLAKEPKPELVHVEWAAEKVSPTLTETLSQLADGDPLPNLAQTGWEETTLTAAPMAKDPQGFIRDLISHNLPLAARCAASPEVKIDDKLRREIQQALIARAQDMKVDLRARITAGEALGEIGDPRFVRHKGPHGEYLLPPLVEIPSGKYPMGDDKSDYDFEKPAHTVELAPFQIGQFPMTNAEYKLFIDAGGYEDPQWWDTEESQAWLRGEASTEGIKQQWRDNRRTAQSWGEDYIRDLVRQNRWTTKQAEDWIERCNWTDEYFEQVLEEWYPSDKLYRQPEFWDDTRFNNPSQPVVGVTWFEARAYCNWLTANVRADAAMKDRLFRLPTEAEFEAAARGTKGRMFPYGKTFDASRSNTFESHIRRTTPVGIFENATPEGAYDLSGNAYTWTLSIYDREKFPYPYKKDDGREEIQHAGINRVLRGGSWIDIRVGARAVCRVNYDPANRFNFTGFRVVVASPFSL